MTKQLDLEFDDNVIDLSHLSNDVVLDQGLTITAGGSGSPYIYSSGVTGGGGFIASGTTILGGGGGAFTTSTISPTFTLDDSLTFDHLNSSKLSIYGENADIEINGKSLCTWMKSIEERLNIMTPNLELEGEWEELKSLGEQYRDLERKIQEKMATWDTLKKMPPPHIP